MNDSEVKSSGSTAVTGNLTTGFGSDLPGQYRIRLRGKLRQEWSKWFYDMTLTVVNEADGMPVTILAGYLPDQTALHGLLERIRDTGLQILSLDLLEGGGDPVGPESGEPAQDLDR
jgi:hypothetical protein